MGTASDIELIAGVYDAIRKGDVGSIIDHLTDNINWWYYAPQVVPFAGHHYSREGVLAYLRNVSEVLESQQMNAREFATSRNLVVALGWQKARVRITGKVFETHWAHAYTFEAGLITSVREYVDAAAVAAAFTLS